MSWKSRHYPMQKIWRHNGGIWEIQCFTQWWRYWGFALEWHETAVCVSIGPLTVMKIRPWKPK